MKNSLPCLSAVVLPCLFSSLLVGAKSGCALPPPADIPEEVLRTEIITEARSPIDGKPLTAAEYAQLQVQLQNGLFPPQINPELRHLIFLGRVRKLLQSIIPIRIPIRLQRQGP